MAIEGPGLEAERSQILARRSVDLGESSASVEFAFACLQREYVGVVAPTCGEKGDTTTALVYAPTAAKFFLGLPSTAVKLPPMYTLPFLTASERTTASRPVTFGLHVRMAAPVLTLMAATLFTVKLVPDF